MTSISMSFAQGLRLAANWLSGCSLAHFFAVTRWQERRIAQLEADNERLRQEAWRWQQMVAEQAARFAEERKDVLDRFAPRVPSPLPDDVPSGGKEWEMLANELAGSNPIDRRIRQAQWEDEQRFRQQDALFGEVLAEGLAADAEADEELRRQFAERARQARANELGAV